MAVRAVGLVAAEPGPGVGFDRGVGATFFGGNEAGDVVGREAVRGGGVEEGGDEVERGEGLGEEFLEGAGFGAEEGAGLGVSWGCQFGVFGGGTGGSGGKEGLG